MGEAEADKMNALAVKASEQLVGSCMSMANLGEEYEEAENNSIFCAKLDELCFCCNDCNWWYEQSEMSDEDWVCVECHRHANDEEE